MGQKLGGGCAFFLGLGPHRTQVAWAEAYLRTKCYPGTYNRLATIEMGRKLGALSPFWGGQLGPHLAQCGLDRSPPPRQVPS